MTRFYILRHGQTEWNHHGNRYCGISDIALNETGRTQASKAAAALEDAGISVVYCSPLKRARETASIISQALGLDPVVDERIREIDFGRWEGKTKQEIETDYPDGWRQWLNNPGNVRAGETGESGEDVWLRLKSFIETKSGQHRNESVLLVGHNTSNRLLIAGSLGLHFSKYRSFLQHNAAISVLETDEGELRWAHINQTSHLI